MTGWLPRGIKGEDALEILRLREEEGLSWPKIAKKLGWSRQTVWRRRAWFEENYPLHSGLPVQWGGRKQSLQPNTGMPGIQTKRRKAPEGFVQEPVEIPEFKVDPAEVYEQDLKAARLWAAMMNFDTPAPPSDPKPVLERTHPETSDSFHNGPDDRSDATEI